MKKIDGCDTLTVQELIERLAALPGDMPVMFSYYEGWSTVSACAAPPAQSALPAIVLSGEYVG